MTCRSWDDGEKHHLLQVPISFVSSAKEEYLINSWEFMIISVEEKRVVPVVKVVF
jgi:hypothetical protein